MKDLVRSSNPDIVSRWHQICDDQESAQHRWVAGLRERGFKAAHPNDGWVDRENNEINFNYPQFNDGAGVGDLVMLGQHFSNPEELRPVRLTGSVKSVFFDDVFSFEDAPEA